MCAYVREYWEKNSRQYNCILLYGYNMYTYMYMYEPAHAHTYNTNSHTHVQTRMHNNAKNSQHPSFNNPLPTVKFHTCHIYTYIHISILDICICTHTHTTHTHPYRCTNDGIVLDGCYGSNDISALTAGSARDVESHERDAAFLAH